MYPVPLGAISVRGVAMLLANVITTKFALDAQRLAIKTTHALRISSVLIVEKNMHLIIQKCI